MFASVFQTLIVQPIFNFLVFIYALLPGHNFGLALILFTIAVRLIMWPLVRKQLHHTKAMRAMQPELKRIKKEAAGDRQKEAQLQMELYKERQINPFAPIGLLIVQFIILIGLYQGLTKVIANPSAIIDNAYSWVRSMSWLQVLAQDISKFDTSLLGFIDLKRAAVGDGGVYWPAMALVVGSAAIQFFQSKQLMPNDKDGRSLRKILKDAGKGQQADQAEVNAAVGQSTKYFIPALILFFTINIASALSLYWLVGGLVAYLQQAQVLKEDEVEMEAIAEETPTGDKPVLEGEVIAPVQKPSKKKKSSAKKRRKR